MVSDEQIRGLCARVVKAKGPDFQAALMELQKAVEARLGPEPEIGSESEIGRQAKK